MGVGSDIQTYYKKACLNANNNNRTILTQLHEISGPREKINVNVLCNLCGDIRNIHLCNLHSKPRGCPSCSGTTSLVEIKSKLQARGFYDVSKKLSVITYKCKHCSSDEYVQAGLCDGVFTSDWCNLKDGGTSCRCSVKPIWTPAQQEYRINKAFGNKAKFVRWDSDYLGVKSKFWAKCENHGEWKAAVSDVINSGSGCPLCAKTGYAEGLPGILYVLSSENSTKLGITNISANNRTAYVSRKSKDIFEVIKEWKWEDGSIAPRIERKLLSELREFYSNPIEKHHGYTECFVGLSSELLVNLVEDLIKGDAIVSPE